MRLGVHKMAEADGMGDARFLESAWRQHSSPSALGRPSLLESVHPRLPVSPPLRQASIPVAEQISSLFPGTTSGRSRRGIGQLSGMATRGAMLATAAPSVQGVISRCCRRPFTAATHRRTQSSGCECSGRQQTEPAQDVTTPSRRRMLSCMLVAASAQAVPLQLSSPAAAYTPPPAGVAIR